MWIQEGLAFTVWILVGLELHVFTCTKHIWINAVRVSQGPMSSYCQVDLFDHSNYGVDPCGLGLTWICTLGFFEMYFP